MDRRSDPSEVNSPRVAVRDRSASKSGTNSATHKLVIYVDRKVRYAEVTVEVRPRTDGPLVQIAEGALDWQSDDSGLSKSFSTPENPFLRGAIAGVQHALSNLGSRTTEEQNSVLITSIQILLVDSTPMAVGAAACRATWLALGVEGRNPPVVGEADMELPGSPHIPKLFPI